MSALSIVASTATIAPRYVQRDLPCTRCFLIDCADLDSRGVSARRSACHYDLSARRFRDVSAREPSMPRLTFANAGRREAARTTRAYGIRPECLEEGKGEGEGGRERSNSFGLGRKSGEVRRYSPHEVSRDRPAPANSGSSNRVWRGRRRRIDRCRRRVVWEARRGVGSVGRTPRIASRAPQFRLGAKRAVNGESARKTRGRILNETCIRRILFGLLEN